MMSYGIYTVVLLILAGQSQECENDAVGVGDRRLPDAQLDASSSTSTAPDGRLGNHASWCADDGDQSAYLQIDLGTNYVICAVATQGDATGNRWVETYQLQSSTDGTAWTNYTENGSNKVMNGNSNPTYVTKRNLLSRIFGRYVRFIPKEFHGARCLRVELYGSLVVEEDEAVGVANQTAFPNWRFSSPSEYDSRFKAHKARLNGPFGWAPKDGDRGTAHLQIDLGTVYTIYGIATQGTGGSSGSNGGREWAKTYKLEYSLDNTTWTFYKEGSTIQIFKGNVNQQSIVKNVLPSTVSAVAIRIKPASYQSYPTLRVELYHIPFPKVDPSKALGISNVTAFPNSRFSSRSEYDTTRHNAHKARLNGPYGWAPKSGDRATAHLQIDLGTVYTIYAIATQGNGGSSGSNGPQEWAKTYKLECFYNSNWKYYKEGSTPKIFQGNTNQFDTVYNILRIPTKAQSIRVYPKSYNAYPTLRVELYQPPYRPKVYSEMAVGLVNKTTIPDNRYSSPSSQSDKMPDLARLHGVKGWAPQTTDKDSAYLEIDLGAVYIVCAIATQGYSGSDNYWVTQYQLKLSMNGENWRFDDTFQGNYDKTSVVKNFIRPPTQAKFVHIKPNAYNVNPALRVEVYGSIREIFSPFGLENNIVPDTNLKASSSRDANHTAKEGRLYNSEAWCAGGSGTNEYLQINLGRIVTITGLATQGEPRGTGWVKTYNVRYSNNGKKWRIVQTPNVFKGNSNNTKVFANWFAGSLAAQFLKIEPQTYEKAICLRTEIYGSTVVELPVLRPILQNQTLQKQPNSSVVMTCNVYSPGVVQIVWLINRIDVSNSSSVVTRVPQSTFSSPTVTTLTIAYGNASLAKSRFKCRKVSEIQREMNCLPLEVECKATATGTTVSSTSFISLHKNLVLPAKPEAPTLLAMGENFLNISWRRTQPGDGSIISYSVFYQKKNNESNDNIEVTVSGSEAQNITAQIAGLQPFTHCFVWLRAVSAIGSGPISENSSFTTGLTASMNLTPSTQTLKFSSNESFQTLRCSAQGFPLPTLVWKRNGLTVNASSQLSISTQQLSMNNITSEIDLRPGGLNVHEAGNYTCEVYNGVDDQGVLSATVQVFFLPRVFVMESRKLIFRRGVKNTTLTCVGHGYPTPIVYWMKDSKTVETVTFDQLGNFSNKIIQVKIHVSSPLNNVTSILYLRTSGLTYEEAGNYTCVVSNGPDSDHSVRSAVEVLFRPEFTSTPTNQVVLQGRNVTFNCSATGVPSPSIRWLFSGNISSFTSNQRELTLYSVQNTINFEGNYTCVAESRVGTDSVRASLTVDVAPAIFNQLKNQTVELGSTFTMLCDVTGDPTPIVTWEIENNATSRNRSISSDGRNLTVSVLSLDQNGFIQCYAKNCRGIATSSAWVEVIVAPKVYISSRTLKLLKGEKNHTVVCHGSGYPSPHIVWRKDGQDIATVSEVTTNDTRRLVQVLSNGSSLAVTANISSALYLRVGGITYNDAGNYTCIVTIRSEEKTIASQSLEVMFLPQIVTAPPNRTVNSGSNVTFPCVAYGVPKPRITWKFSGGVLPPQRYHDDNITILFVNNSVSFEGGYTCVASNKAGETKATAWLTVDVQPRITSTFSNRTLLLNETFNLTCETTGDPAPSVIWVKDGSTESRNQVLTIDKVKLGDIGQYQCIANNRAGNSTVSVWLDVHVLPQIVTTPSNRTVISGSNVTFPCVAYGVPKPTITWKFSGGVLPLHRYYGDNLTILFVNNSVSFEGGYTCVASNKAGETNTTAWLTVDVPSKITSAFSNRTLLIDETFNLTCEAFGDPTPSVTWVKDGSRKSSNRVLTIEKVDLGDIGRYQCIASNRARNSSVSVWLNVQVPATVRISPPLTRIFVKEQQNISFDCYGNGKPVPSVMWTRNNSLVHVAESFSEENTDRVVQVITGNSSFLQNVTARLFLRTAGVTYSEAGNYTCTANNTIMGSASLSKQNVEVLFKPQFTERPSNATVLSGVNVSFSCKATGYPKPTIGWNFSVGDLPRHVLNDDRTLLNVLFVNNSAKYEGFYTCTASSRAGINSARAWLTVNVPPKILSTTTSQTLLITEKLTLKCEATGEPQPIVFWMKGDVKISNSSVLTIEKVDFRDRGQYQCVANSTAGKATASVWVYIEAHAQVYLSPPFTRSLVKHQENVTISCYGNGYPEPSIQWIKNGTLIPIVDSVSKEDAKRVVQVITEISSPLENVTARLFLRTAGVTYSEAGNYTCTANNTIMGSASLSKQSVEILFKPQFTEQPSNATVLSGVNVSFSCKATGYPKPTIVWSFSGGKLPQHVLNDDRTQLNVLFINNSAIYEGSYTCTASSRAGTNSARAWLTVDVPPKILSKTANQSLLINEKLQLQCNATGEPQPDVFWMKGGVQKSSGSIFTIEKVDFYDNGRYQCIAKSRAGNATASVWVDIQAHAQVYVNQPFTRSLVRHQENVTISCYGNGYPEPSVQWMKNDTLIPIVNSVSKEDAKRVVQVITGISSSLQNVTARLLLRTAGVTYSEAGNYTCTANNTIKGNVSLSKQSVEVLFKPEFVIKPKSAIRLEKQSVRFNCSAVGLPSPSLSWSFSNGELPEHTLRGNDLVIESVQNDFGYEGVFTCTASSRAGTANTSAELVVQVPPSINKPPESLVAERWSTVRFNCSASGDPTPTYIWKVSDHERKSSRIELQDQNRTFILYNVTEKDDGIYTCISSNVAGRTEKSANLTVHARPRIVTKLKPNTTVVEGNTINFTCIGEGIPAPKITWLRSSKLLEAEGRYDISITGDTKKHSVLTIRSVEYRDRGDYTCVAKNERGNTNTTTYLTVYVSTSITEVPKPVAQEIKKTVTLKCLARGYLLPSIKWKKAEMDITGNSRVVINIKPNATSLLVQSILNIDKVERNDTENYTCIASNNINEVQSRATITVLEKPDKLQVQLINTTAREISISWAVTFDGNLPVLWFSVSYNVSQSRNFCNISSDKERTTLPDLKPFTVYNLHITANNKMGKSEPAVLLVRTSEWRPESPRNVSTTVINSTSFQVTWITPLITNGIIESYVVYYWPSHGNVTYNITVLAPRTLAVVTDLVPYINYSCQIQAFTSVGGGNLSMPIVYVQTLEDAPTAPRDLKVKELDAFSITLQWRRPHILNGVLRGYTVSFSNKDGLFSNINKTTGYLTDPVVFKIGKLEPFTRYRIKVRAFTVKYSVYSGEISQQTSESAPGEPTDVSLTKSEKDVTVKWKVPNELNGIIIGYNVYFEVIKHTGEDKPKDKVFTTKNNATGKVISLEELNGATKYGVKVSAKTKAGEGKKSLSEVNLETKPSKPPEPPTPPSPANQTDSTAVFEIPKFSDVNGNIKYYRIYVTVYPTTNYKGSSQDVQIVSWKSVYDIVDEFNRPFAYLAFQFTGEKYDAYRVFTVGGEDAYSKKRKRRQTEPEYKNMKLKANRKYEVFVRGYVTDNLFTESKPAPIKTKSPNPIQKPPGSSATTVAVVVVLIVILVAVFFVGIYVRRKRRMSTNGRDESIRLESMPTGDSEDIYDEPISVEQKVPIPVESLKQHFLRMHGDDDLLFKEEFKSIQTPGNPTTEVCDVAENRTKNRYLNIKAYDHSRVLLSRKPGIDNSDYINANYIDGYNYKNRYIATIGPKQETEDDFWRMVLERGSSIIVMLTRCVENGKIKCHEYWPSEGSRDYNGINVVLMDSEELADYEIRTFKVHTPSRPNEAPRIVTHFFFTAWPDHDVPDHATSLLEFWRRVKSTMPDSKGPIIVHCSAGVGRTGTFIVIDAMMDQIEAQGEVDIYNFVTHIRGQRNFMVQRESQYTFIHYAILEAVTFGKTEIAVQDLRVSLRKLNTKDRSNGESEIQRQFRLLDGAVPDENTDFTTALLPENRSKNRHTNIFPFDRTRVELPLIQNNEGQDTTYINASYIGGYQLKTAFIATQAPLQNTVVDFWRMVWDQGIYSIVMLMQENEPLKVPLAQYLPEKGAFLSGNINVELVEQTSNKGFVERQISLTNTEVGEVRKVRHFHYTEWPVNSCPANPSSLINMIGCVQKVQMQTGNKPIVVHCSDGVGRTGAFCCVSTCLERVKTEGIIDVFITARMLRTQRPGMIKTMEQYRFCYDALVAYLESFEEYQYQNFQ